MVSEGAVLKIIRGALLIAAIAGVCSVAACGGSSSQSQSAPASAPPLERLRAVALSKHATKAWWVKVPLSRAFKLFGGSWSSSAETAGSTTPVYVLIMKGNLGTAKKGVHYRWAIEVPEDFSADSVMSTDRFNTEGLTLTPLNLSSPLVVNDAVLGPYPMNVPVNLGKVVMTLTSVSIMAPDAKAGSAMISVWGGSLAPAGSRYVDVTLRVYDSTSKYLGEPAHPYRTPVVIAGGKTIAVGERGSSTSRDDWTFTEDMEFAVPDDATSAILRLPLPPRLSSAGAVVLFRLW